MMPLTKTAFFPDRALSGTSSRLDSREAIAGEIVHDLNNIFASLEIASHLLDQEMPTARRDSLLASVAEATRRGRRLVDEMERHNERQPTESIPLDVEILLEAVVRNARSHLTGGISIETTYESGVAPIEGNPDELYRLLSSLLEEIVARTPETGLIAVRCLPAGRSGSTAADDSPAVEVEIEHTASVAAEGSRTLWHLMTRDHVPIDADLVRVAPNRWCLRLPATEPSPAPASRPGSKAHGPQPTLLEARAPR